MNVVQHIVTYTLLLPSLMCSTYAERIDAKLDTESAWVGEGVSLYITLWAKGPFSGTAAFDLPTKSRTFIIKEGSPVVGSESSGGESWLTQRHEFRIFTQESGEVVIPPINVRFEAKKDYVSAPEPFAGTTPPLHFISNRPPGTEGMSLVMAAQHLQVEQVWSPQPGTELKPGTVVQRTITRRAVGTTAMVFPDISAEVQDGVRRYQDLPVVEDRAERGQSMSLRVDTIKYQFYEGGSFDLPELDFIWWNPEGETLEYRSLSGASFSVAVVLVETPKTHIFMGWISGSIFVGLLLSVVILLRRQWSKEEWSCARNVVRTCGKNSALEAYAALLQWFRISETGSDLLPEEDWRLLMTAIYSERRINWSGDSMKRAFIRSRRDYRRRKDPRSRGNSLPSLNPMQKTRQ